jgi:CheY-like chemotaxis protein/signal transduction histidine kinase
MRILLLLILLEASCLVSFGQSRELDSLANSLAHTSDKFKAKYFANLAGKKLDSHATDARLFAQKAVELASQAGVWQLKGAALGYLGEAYLQDRDTVQAILSLEKQRQILSDHQDSLGVANAQLKLGQLYLADGDTILSKNAALASLTGYRSVHDTLGMAAAYGLLADVSHRLKDEKSANESLKVALSLMEEKAISEKGQLQTLQIQSIQDKRIRGLLFVLIGIAGFLAALLSILYKRKQFDNHKLAAQVAENLAQKTEIEELVKEQELKNTSLDLLNKRLVDEMATREKLQGFSQSKDRYLAAITQEMRSPLNDIAGLAQLLLDNNPKPEQVDQLKVLQYCTNELTSLTNEALGYSNFEDTKSGNNNKEFKLDELVGQVFERIEIKALNSGLLFHHSLDELIPKWLIGSGPRLSNVLSNLLVNCIETTPAGLVNISVLLAGKTDREVIVKVVIETTDKGMLGNLYHHRNLTILIEAGKPQAMEDKLLSLAMTKRMVEVQNGKMQVENLLDEATRFTLLMPFEVISYSHDPQPSDERNYDGLNGLSILLVEDNKINQVVVVKMLRKYGAIVATAENGFEALDLLDQQTFDIVLMDIQMPGMDGYRATAEIRNNPSPAINSLPIIALTSSAYIVEKEKALLFGMNDYVGKPYSPDELLDKINDCLALNSKHG